VTRDPSELRDARLHRVARLRVGLVSAGVIGSLGVAGVVATSGTGASAAPSPAPTQQDVGDDGGLSQWWGDDGGSSDGQQQQQLQAPDLQQGFGQSQGTTSGS
jgi:hypothetical protein